VRLAECNQWAIRWQAEGKRARGQESAYTGASRKQAEGKMAMDDTESRKQAESKRASRGQEEGKQRASRGQAGPKQPGSVFDAMQPYEHALLVAAHLGDGGTHHRPLHCGDVTLLLMCLLCLFDFI
jgi:hypothetical protein